MKILHIISSLDTGGAPGMLYKLLANSDLAHLDATVISLTDISEVGGKIRSLGVDVWAVDMKRGKISPSKILYLAHLIRKIKPDIIQTWMYHADVLGSLAAMLAAPRTPVIWGIRHSNLDPRYNNPVTVKVAKLCGYLSRYLPSRIICCSHEAKETHQLIGYDPKKIIIIPNGFELDIFYPDKKARDEVRKSLGIEQETILIGMVARFDPQKDHHNFVQAAGIVAKKYRNAEFLLCGGDINEQNATLIGWIEQAEIENKIHLLGLRNDVPKILTALDIATLSSLGEAFPNVVGEAMACGIPCVVTDTGDSSLIVGETGVVVPAQNALALANGWTKLIEAGTEGRERLGNNARRRIQSNFDMKAIAARYCEVYKMVLYEPVAVHWPNS
ncbi:MAG: putative Phosphatidylinositol alpha-mannosyltransferase [Firmicutes bacterium]|nr:putative Phosphatidylinositol alpha-mannosyltransferase [Bacillota bacterium]